MPETDPIAYIFDGPAFIELASRHNGMNDLASLQPLFQSGEIRACGSALDFFKAFDENAYKAYRDLGPKNKLRLEEPIYRIAESIRASQNRESINDSAEEISRLHSMSAAVHFRVSLVSGDRIGRRKGVFVIGPMFNINVIHINEFC
jgi:hypothetical protein